MVNKRFGTLVKKYERVNEMGYTYGFDPLTLEIINKRPKLIRVLFKCDGFQAIKCSYDHVWCQQWNRLEFLVQMCCTFVRTNQVKKNWQFCRLSSHCLLMMKPARNQLCCWKALTQWVTQCFLEVGVEGERWQIENVFVDILQRMCVCSGSSFVH